MNQSWKTVVIILVLLTVAPAAILLAQWVMSNADGLVPPGPGTTSPIVSPGVPPTATPFPLQCRGRDEFEVSQADIEVTQECCTAAVVGELRNTCNRPLLGSVGVALRSVVGRLLAIGNTETVVGPIGPGERTFFRVDFSGPTGWEAARRSDVLPDVSVRAIQVQ